MIINKNIFSSAMTCVDKKEIRDYLKYIVIDYDDETQILFVAGTNSQLLIANEIKITDASDQEFCKKHFGERGAGYLLPESVLTDKKAVNVEFTEIDGRLMCNGALVSKYDGKMRDLRVVIPTKNLIYARVYCGFNPDYIKLLNKAVGFKGIGIEGMRPLVEETDDAKSESLSPHVWYTIETDDQKQTIVLMPLRF